MSQRLRREKQRERTQAEERRASASRVAVCVRELRAGEPGAADRTWAALCELAWACGGVFTVSTFDAGCRYVYEEFFLNPLEPDPAAFVADVRRRLGLRGQFEEGLYVARCDA